MPRQKEEVNKSEIVNRYKNGESLRDICEDYSVSYSTLYRRIEEWDIERSSSIRKIDLPTEKVISMYKDGMSCHEIANKFDCSTTPIKNRLEENNIELGGSKSVNIKEEELEEAVSNHDTVKAIAEQFDCHRSTIDRKLEKFKIDSPDFYNKKATLADINGYQVMQCGVVGKGVLVHRLLAVSEYGYEEVCDNVVHHKNGVKWDNRPSNIEVMSRSDHTKHHAEIENEKTK
jgi:transposase